MRRTVLSLASMGFLVASAALGCLLLAVEPSRAAFPGQNGKVIFVSNRDGDDEIYTTSFAGDSVKRLTRNSRKDSDPSWSADGKKIVFTSGLHIYTMNANGSDLKKIPNTSAGSDPAFSPGRRKIVFTRCYSLYTMNVDGSNRKKLSGEGCPVDYYDEPNYLDSDPEWSPDGKKIAFERLQGWTSIQVVALADRARERVVGDDDHRQDPAWSPDGTRITYTCSCYDDPTSSQGYMDIHKVNANGTDDTRLTTDPAYDAFPAFAPDETRIVFASNRDGDWDLYTMDADGNNVEQLTNNPARDTAPDWQPIG